MNKSLARTYTFLRRGGRHLATSAPFLDRVVGDPLRRWEKRHVPVEQVCQAMATKEVACHGFKLSYPLDDVGTVSSILLYGDYEPVTRKVVQEILKPGMRFVDLGANIGYFTLLAAEAVGPGGRIYAFEPIPSTCDFLTRNVNANGFGEIVEITQKAVCNSRGYVRFTFDEKDSVSAKIQSVIREPTSDLDIEATSLDEFFSSLGWPDVHLVKMDIEGAELAAMEGMEELSDRNPNLKVIFEFLYQNLVERDIQPEELFHSLQRRGFNHFRVLHTHQWLLDFPGAIPRLVSLAKRANVNILAEKV